MKSILTDVKKYYSDAKFLPYRADLKIGILKCSNYALSLKYTIVQHLGTDVGVI